jgi:signal transduction histidine kinase
MKSELARKIDQVYQEQLHRQTLKGGRLVSLFTVLLYIAIVLSDIRNNIPSTIIFWRFVGLVPVTLYTLLAFTGFFSRFKALVIPFYTFALSIGILHMSCISVLMYTLGLESSPIYHVFPAGFVFTLVLCSNFAYGARRIMIYVFPIIIALTNLTFLLYGVDQFRFLIIVDLVTSFSVIIMLNQEKYEYQSVELLELKESELLRSNESLKEANQRLIDVNRALSHDLKTPLRNIGSFAQLASRKLKQGDTKDLEEYLDFVTQGVKKMYKLLEDMLLFSNLSHKDTLQTELVDLNQLLKEVMSNYSGYPQVNSIQFDFDENLPTIEGNPTKLFFLFQNLIDNGIKYNENKNPSISIRSETSEESHLIKVKDNGIGFEVEYADKIFEMFQRLNTGKYEGSGIGLATCKEIVQSMGGQIWVESSPGSGSTFFLQFPR